MTPAERDIANMKTLACLLLFALLCSCEDKRPQVIEKPTPQTTNLETNRLGTTIDAYVQAPNLERAAEVDRAFAELNGEIAELDQRAANSNGDVRATAVSKAADLRSYRDKEHIRYLEAQVRAKSDEAKQSSSDMTEKLKDAAQKTGEGVRDAAEAVKEGVEKSVDKAKEKLP